MLAAETLPATRSINCATLASGRAFDASEFVATIGPLPGLHQEQVRGFLFWEQAWMLPGARLYVNKDPLHDARYRTWHSWANQWSDGSCEVGHFLFGKKDFHVGVTAHSDGTVTSARQMDAQIARADDGYWHEGISYDIDGEPWMCEA